MGGLVSVKGLVTLGGLVSVGGLVYQLPSNMGGLVKWEPW